MNKALGETQALRAGCKGGDKNFRPAADPLPGGARLPKLNQLEMVTTFTYKPSLVRIDSRILSYRGNRPTKPQTPPARCRQDRQKYTASLSLARSVTIRRGFVASGHSLRKRIL